MINSSLYMDNSRALTQGSLFKNIFIFSVPLIFTNLLQTLFNMADVAALGKFASGEALGAVGSTSMIVFFATGILIGIGSGVNALVAFFIGAGKSKDIREALHTSAILCTASGVLIFALGEFFAREILILLHTKDELLEGALLYLRIYLVSLPAVGFYNFGNGILSAEGDTKSPLIYLLISGGMNVALNLLFVIPLKMAESGVAIASVISQFFSAALILAKLVRRDDALALRLKHLKIHREKLMQLVRIGVPAGLQNAVFAFANMFIQMGVNSFESAMVIANAGSSNADPIVYNVMAAFYTAASTFIAQNYGAENKGRILKSYFVSMFYSVAAGILGGAFFVLFGRQFMTLFSENPRVIELGYERLFIMACSFWIAPFMDCTLAASRGLGKTIIPTVMIFLGSCVFRVIWVYTVFTHFGTIFSLFALFPCSWTITAIAEIAYFIKLYRRLPKTI